MRKQYHLWPSAEGVDAWDVRRLIDLSTGLPVVEVELASVEEIDTVYWFDHDDPPTVRKVVEHVALIEEVDTTHPIILGPDNRLMDGMHRIARALLERRSHIRAVRFEELPDPDYRNCRPGDLPND